MSQPNYLLELVIPDNLWHQLWHQAGHCDQPAALLTTEISISGTEFKARAVEVESAPTVYSEEPYELVAVDDRWQWMIDSHRDLLSADNGFNTIDIGIDGGKRYIVFIAPSEMQ